MSAGIQIVGGVGGTERALASPPRTPTNTTNFADQLGPSRGESAPPPEVQAEVQAAARAAARLHELGRQLRFERDQESGEMVIEVRDLDGNLLRRVPPTEVFDFASGRTVA